MLHWLTRWFSSNNRFSHARRFHAPIEPLEPRRLLANGTFFDTRNPGDQLSPAGTTFGNQTVTATALAPEHADVGVGFNAGIDWGNPGEAPHVMEVKLAGTMVYRENLDLAGMGNGAGILRLVSQRRRRSAVRIRLRQRRWHSCRLARPEPDGDCGVHRFRARSRAIHVHRRAVDGLAPAGGSALRATTPTRANHPTPKMHAA